MKIQNIITAFLLVGSATSTNADVCQFLPGSVTCGSGSVNGLTGNGMVKVNGTSIKGLTTINGMLNAKGAEFSSLQVNGSVTLAQCMVNDSADIKGSLNASATKFQNSLDIYSGAIKFASSNINGNVHIHHTDNKKQTVHLDSGTMVSGDIIFDDGNGEVIIKGDSKIGGQVIGGSVLS